MGRRLAPPVSFSIMHLLSWLTTWPALVLLPSLPTVRAQQNTTHFTTLVDAFPDLYTLQKPLTRPTYLGGQDFDRCCRVAVSEMFYIGDDGLLQKRPSTADITIDAGPDAFLNSFPCNASYSQNPNGSPTVAVSFNWCSSNCGGWELSSGSNLKQWVQPLVGFILPAVVFCLAIPRRRRLYIPDSLFPSDVTNWMKLFKAMFFAITAALIVTVDTIVWLCVVFAFSGPLLLSGLYEALLDKRVIDHMQEKLDNRRLSVQMRARIYYTVLVGNLDVDQAWNSTMDLTSRLPNTIPDTDTLALRSPRPGVGSSLEQMKAGPLFNTRESAYAPDGSRDVSPSAPAGRTLRPDDEVQSIGDRLQPIGHSRTTSQASPYPPPMQELDFRKHIAETRIRLNAMLACQYSFGSIVGAPVVFFIGSFIFALLSVKTDLGDNDTSHALAFGMWWMSIPHLAIVTGCLLAGNNPNTLEAIVTESINAEQADSAAAGEAPKSFREHMRSWMGTVVVPTYEAHYQPAWMWERGRSKREWVMKLCQEFHDEDPVELRQLRNSLRMSPGDWTMISLFAFMLFFIPCLLGLLVSYYTPVVAVSCRSLTCIVYAAAQTVLLLLWIWNFTWRDQRWYDRRKSWRREDREARVERDLRNGSILSMPRRLEPDGQHPSASEKASAGLPWSRVQRFIFWPLMVISVGVATFSAIGGTMLQIMGGYRNCVCWIATSAWASPSSSMLLLSTNSADDISYASRTWLSIGGVATGFLAIVCYFGWWYQRRLRHQFTALVVDLDRYQVGGSRKRG